MGGVKCSVEDKLKAVLDIRRVVEGWRMRDMRGEYCRAWLIILSINLKETMQRMKC